MPFDLSTAKPIGPAGFDINTAKPFNKNGERDQGINQDQFAEFKSMLLSQARGEQVDENKLQQLQSSLSQQQEDRPEYKSPQPTAEELKAAPPSLDVVDMFTGERRMTPELEALPNLGEAPEFNEFSPESLMSNISTFTTGDAEELKTIFKKQYGDRVSFSKDSKGNDIVNFESGSYALNKPGISPQDVPKFFGDLLAFSPAGKAKTIGGAMVKSALGEGALESIDKLLGGDFDSEEVAISAMLGGGFKTVEDVLGAIYRGVKGKITPEATQTLKEGADSAIPVMTSDVLPPKTFVGKTSQQISEKIPLVGTGGIRETQQQFRQSAVEDIVQKYESYSYASIIDSLKSKKNKIKSAAGGVLESAGNKLDDVGEIPTEGTIKAMQEVEGELSKKGVIQSSKAIEDLNQLMDAITSAPQTYTTLKENRTAFREVVDSIDPTSRSQLTSRAKGLLKKVQSSMTNDMIGFAKENLTAQEFLKLKNANSVYASEAEKLTKTKLKNILDKGEYSPETVKQMLFSKSQSEIDMLYKSLTFEGRNNARSAIISRVVENVKSRASGLTPNSFATELKKNQRQVSTFFKGKEMSQLQGLQRVLDSTRRAQDATVSTPTGQALIPIATGAAAATDLGLTALIAGTAGGSARLYESAPVRNVLLKLAGTPKGSTAYEKVLADARYTLNAIAQSMKTELSKEGQTQE